MLRLLFNLGYRGLLFASTTNLEAGPRFAGIWLRFKKMFNSIKVCLVFKSLKVALAHGPTFRGFLERPGHMIEHLTRRDRERTAPEAETSELGGVCKQK